MTTLYSTKCPKCNILEKKLKEKNIDYIEVNDVNSMLELGLKDVPWLKVENEMMNFQEAIQWVNKQ